MSFEYELGEVDVCEPSAKLRFLRVLFAALLDGPTDTALALEMLNVVCPVVENPENQGLVDECVPGLLKVAARFENFPEVLTVCYGAIWVLSERAELRTRLMTTVPQLLDALEKFPAVKLTTTCTAILKFLSYCPENREALGVVLPQLRRIMGTRMDFPVIVRNCADCFWNLSLCSANQGPMITVLPLLQEAMTTYKDAANVLNLCVGCLRGLAVDLDNAHELVECIPLVLGVLEKYFDTREGLGLVEHCVAFFWNLSYSKDSLAALAVVLPKVGLCLSGNYTSAPLRKFCFGVLAALSSNPKNTSAVMLQIQRFAHAWSIANNDVEDASNAVCTVNNLAFNATKAQLKRLAEVSYWSMNQGLRKHKTNARFLRSCVSTLTTFAVNDETRPRVKLSVSEVREALACHPDDTELAESCAGFFALIEDDSADGSALAPAKKQARRE